MILRARRHSSGIRTGGCGNPAVLSPLSPLAVPLLLTSIEPRHRRRDRSGGRRAPPVGGNTPETHHVLSPARALFALGDTRVEPRPEGTRQGQSPGPPA